MNFIGAIFQGIDGLFRGVWNGIRDGVRSLWDGPFQGLLFYAVLWVYGLLVIVEFLAGWLDRIAGWVERTLVFGAMLGMTFLVFMEFLARTYKGWYQTELEGIWALEGQANMALLLMVVVGFLGGSLATQERKHLAIDGYARVVAPGAATFIQRITALVAAGLCYVLGTGAWHLMIEAGHDKVPGLKVWSWFVAPVNWLVSWMPGDKYGPNAETFEKYGANYADYDAWENAMFDLGKEWDDLGTAFRFVEAGDGFPLPIPMLLLVVAFTLMGVRFLGQVLYPPGIPEPPSTREYTRRPGDVILAGIFPGVVMSLFCASYFGVGAAILMVAVTLVFMGAPLFVAVGVGTLASWVFLRDGASHQVVSDMFEATYKQELLAIPFFVLAGNLMTKGSIAKRLIDFARALLGPMPGGLGVGAVLSCAIFAAISGSSPVTVIAIGSILFPMLIKEGYEQDYSVGVLTTAGGLGIIIPPSIPMIVYAIVVGGIPDANPDTLPTGVMPEDIVTNAVATPQNLFVAGVMPGVFIALTLMAYTLYVAWPRDGFEGYGGKTNDDGMGYFERVGRTFARGALSLFLPVLILGGIYGFFDFEPLNIAMTVNEAAAVAVVYALFVELVINRELKIWQLPEVISESAIMMGTLFLILVIAISLNRFFVFQEIPEAATELMMSYVDSRVAFLIVVNLFLLALGCVMDILSAILIVAPLLAPIAQAYGIHPVHFGIMFIVNLELGYLTPPLGINLFVASTVFEKPIVDVIRAVIPFLFLMLFCLFVIVYVPWLSLAFL